MFDAFVLVCLSFLTGRTDERKVKEWSEKIQALTIPERHRLMVELRAGISLAVNSRRVESATRLLWIEQEFDL